MGAIPIGRFVPIVLLAMPGLLWGAGEGEGSEEVNVYSYRHYPIDRVLYGEFERQTGIRVNLIEADADSLIERLRAEESDSPADLLMTVDAGRLYRAKELGLFQSISSPKLAAAIPEHLRDPEGYWFGLTKRARIIVYHRDRVAPSSLSTYEALSEPQWRGRLVMRSSRNIYNISLLASIIVHGGERQAHDWAAGMISNLARKPQGNDRDQVKAIAAGIGDVAIVNSYYVGLMLSSDDPTQREAAEQIAIFFPNQEDRGTHINVSGGGVTAHAPNPDNAIALLEFLVEEAVQARFAAVNHEYPILPNGSLSTVTGAWGNFQEDRLSLDQLGRDAHTASIIFDEVDWR